MSVNGDAARRDELIAEVFASRVALYDGQGVAENIGRKVYLGLFADTEPRIASETRSTPPRRPISPRTRPFTEMNSAQNTKRTR